MSEDSQRFSEAKQVVYRYLRYRPRSTEEIRTKLESQAFETELIDKTISYFKKIGLIDDKAFARLWMRSRLKKPYGIRRIRQELKHLGIPDHLITDAKNFAAKNHDEESAAITLAVKRVKQYQPLTRAAKRRRLFGYLERRGFAVASIIKALRELGL